MRRPVQFKDELRYLRREGNRKVRAQRRRRSALRMGLGVLTWTALAAAGLGAVLLSVRWAVTSPRFEVAHIDVRGTVEAEADEVAALAGEFVGENIFGVSLVKVEEKVREHRWIASGGWVRIRRSLPSTLVITVREREPAGLALVGGDLFLLDEAGLPIDRYGPGYATWDFPIIKGLDGLREERPGGGRGLQEALATGVDVTRELAAREPAFYDQVSEIDLSEPSMIVLRLDGETYDLRLSRESCLRNLENYFALRDQIKDGSEDDIEYVDLRWQDRIAVMPAATVVEHNGGR